MQFVLFFCSFVFLMGFARHLESNHPALRLCLEEESDGSVTSVSAIGVYVASRLQRKEAGRKGEASPPPGSVCSNRVPIVA